MAVTHCAFWPSSQVSFFSFQLLWLFPKTGRVLTKNPLVLFLFLLPCSMAFHVVFAWSALCLPIEGSTRKTKWCNMAFLLARMTFYQQAWDLNFGQKFQYGSFPSSRENWSTCRNIQKLAPMDRLIVKEKTLWLLYTFKAFIRNENLMNWFESNKSFSGRRACVFLGLMVDDNRMRKWEQ